MKIVRKDVRRSTLKERKMRNPFLRSGGGVIEYQSFKIPQCQQSSLENISYKTWDIMAKNEKLLRGPICVLRSKERTNVPEEWLNEKENIITHYDNRSCLQIFFTNDTGGPKFSDCHCLLLPPDSYTLYLETQFATNQSNENILCSLYFPKTFQTRSTTFTFIQRLFTVGLFCQEIRFNCGTDIRDVKFLKHKLAPYLECDGFTNTCLITFCKKYSVVNFLEFLQVLSEWFPENKICGIWGGIIDALSVCQIVYKKEFCGVDTEFSFILINSPYMNVWTELLDDDDDSEIKIKEKLRIMKEHIKLRTHSVALMHINTPRLSKFYSLDLNIFQEIFPNLSLFPIYGVAVLHGNSFNDFTENFVARTSNRTAANTSIMIITYG
ncbi:hypothetical protein M0804_009703 [Polistes exclamans]|nr:hypothetical protein M0804_009703 [Polistes exclamans]